MPTTNDSANDSSNGSSGANTDASGKGDKNKQNGDSESKGQVSYETYLKTLDEAKKAKEKLRSLEEEKNRVAEEKMKSEGNWKGLLEAREARIKELEEETNSIKSQYGELNERITGSKKLSKVLSKLGGDLDEKYFGLIDISEVKINPETGDIDDMSAAKVAENFRTMFPETIKKKFNPSSMGENKTGNSSSGEQSTIAYADWCKLNWAEKKKWKYSQIK